MAGLKDLSIEGTFCSTPTPALPRGVDCWACFAPWKMSERSSAQGYCSLSPLGDHTTSGQKEQALSSTGQRAGKAQAARGGEGWHLG